MNEPQPGAAEQRRIAWVDASIGASGDMLLGALVDAGVPIEVMQSAIDQLSMGITLTYDDVVRGGLGATKVHVDAPEQTSARHLPEIETMLAIIESPIGERATAVFRRLARAEASVHRTSIEAVHFHEVGAADALADVVGVVAGLDHLNLDGLACSTLGLGSGSVRAAHGRLPVPVPAVLELVVGAPVAAGPAPFEALTPTGAAILTQFTHTWGPLPEMAVEAVGSGAGSRDAQEFANVVRLVVGTVVDTAGTPMMQLDANVDDLDPRLWPHAIDQILTAGAVDAWLTPITMKKGRPAFTVSALFEASKADAVRAAVFAHTSTIGVRQHVVTRETLARESSTVDLDGEQIRSKVATRDGEVINRSIEWDDVAQAAQALGRPPKDVLAAAEALLETSDIDRQGDS